MTFDLDQARAPEKNARRSAPPNDGRRSNAPQNPVWRSLARQRRAEPQPLFPSGLHFGAPHDASEREAGAVADRVMRMPQPGSEGEAVQGFTSRADTSRAARRAHRLEETELWPQNSQTDEQQRRGLCFARQSFRPLHRPKT